MAEDLLGLFGEGQRGGRNNALAGPALAFDLSADVLGFDLEAAKDLVDRLLALPQDAEKDVLGLDDPAAELARLVVGEEEGPPCPFVVPLKPAVGFSVARRVPGNFRNPPPQLLAELLEKARENLASDGFLEEPSAVDATPSSADSRPRATTIPPSY